MDKLFDCEDANFYREAIAKLKEHGVGFMVGGAFAVHHYTGCWRNTHDVDLYTTPERVESAGQALNAAGFLDIGEQAEGDRQWIYHSRKGRVIVDVIWRSANLISYVTPDWFARAPMGTFADAEVAFMPMEELVWIKVFVINRHRCDWPDILRILKSQCGKLDWDRLLDLLGENWPLMSALADVFDWQYPARRDCIPERIRREFAQRRETWRATSTDVEREDLLDPWLHLRVKNHEIWCDEQPDDGPAR